VNSGREQPFYYLRIDDGTAFLTMNIRMDVRVRQGTVGMHEVSEADGLET